MRLAEKPPIEKPENSETASLKPLHPKLKMYAIDPTKSAGKTNIIKVGIKLGHAVKMSIMVRMWPNVHAVSHAGLTMSTAKADGPA